MILKNYTKIHFVGVGGIGVSAVAKLCLEFGKKVSGSDTRDSEIISDLKKMGAEIFLGHNESNLKNDTDLIIYSPAVPKDNPELLKAINLKITLKSYPEILGVIMEGFKERITVSGTNGKTTTTTLTGLILEKAGFDPTVIVGGKVREWNGNLKIGKPEEYFIAEACEYKRAMLNLNPKIIVLTNICEDHLDYYKGIEDIKSAFIEYIKKLPQDGLLIYNADDKVSKEIADSFEISKLSYGLNFAADLKAVNIVQESGKQTFDLEWKGNIIRDFQIFIPGTFNIENSMAASLLALKLGIAPGIIKEVLKNFHGTWRRFEKIGEIGKTIIISDYAHHPAAIKETLKGAKNFYPSKKILAVFQPHQKDRTIKLFDEFVDSFNNADEAIISEIYSVEGRNEVERDISSKDIVNEIRKKYKSFPVFYSKNLEETENLILEKISGFDIVLIMGAGDIYKIADNLARKNIYSDIQSASEISA